MNLNTLNGSQVVALLFTGATVVLSLYNLIQHDIRRKLRDQSIRDTVAVILSLVIFISVLVSNLTLFKGGLVLLGICDLLWAIRSRSRYSTVIMVSDSAPAEEQAEGEIYLPVLNSQLHAAYRREFWLYLVTGIVTIIVGLI